MYIVRDKKKKTILHTVNSQPGVDLTPEQVFPGFNPKSMEMGRFAEQFVPDEFTIEDGVVTAVEEKAPVQDLDSLKEAKLEAASRRAFKERQKLIPDYQMMNAALGVYPEKRTKEIQETVKAFREEYLRFEEKVKKARSKKDVEGLEPSFPTKLVR